MLVLPSLAAMPRPHPEALASPNVTTSRQGLDAEPAFNLHAMRETIQGHSGRGHYPRWDPEPLVRGWWGDPGPSQEPPDCSASSGMHYYALRGEYGETNNALIEVAKAVRYVVAQAMQPAALVLERSSLHLRELSQYEYVAAFRSWACVLTELPPGASAEPIDAKEIYYGEADTEEEGLFVSAVLHQVMLRPTAGLRELVEAFEVGELGGPGHYNAVHLRWLEGTCIERMNSEWGGRPQLGCQAVPAATAEDVCAMADSFLDASLAPAAASLPLFLAHDGQQPDRARALTSERGAKSVPDGSKSVSMDMQLLLRSSFFVGNPASSLSVNVARVRAVYFGGGQPACNLVVECLNINAAERFAQAEQLAGRRTPHLGPAAAGL